MAIYKLLLTTITLIHMDDMYMGEQEKGVQCEWVEVSGIMV